MADLVTPEEVADQLPALADHPALAALIAEASGAILAAVGRPILAGEQTERLNGSAWGRLWLKVTPVTELVEITIADGEPEDLDRFDVVPETGELFYRVAGDPRYGPRFPRGRGNVVVKYVGGFDPVPPIIKKACILTIQALADAPGFARAGQLTSYSFAGESFGFADASKASAVPPVALALLSDFTDDGI